MKKAGELAAETLREVASYVQPGMTTQQLDQIASVFIRKNRAVATFVGYRGFPSTICVSVNEEVVHGLPGKRKLKEGDVVSVDVAVTIDGFVGDTAATFLIPPVSESAKKLVDVTRASLSLGIDLMKVGSRLGDIGAGIQKYVESFGYGVVRDFVGHGIGRQMHEEPAVPNYGTSGTGLRLDPGLVLALEPMVTLGDWKVKTLDDGWTVVTLDGSLAAHFEHTIAITEEGPVVLT